MFASIELLPERLVVPGLEIGGLHEHAMVLAFYLLESVAEHAQEQLISRYHFAGRREFDDGLDQRNGVEFTLELCVSELGLRYVPGHFDDFQNLAAGIDHRTVRRLDPDLPSAFADALVLASVEFAAAEFCPEFAIFRRVDVFGLDEQAVMLADDFRRLVTQRFAEVFVRRENFSRRIELDDGERSADRVQGGFICFGGAVESKH